MKRQSRSYKLMIARLDDPSATSGFPRGLPTGPRPKPKPKPPETLPANMVEMLLEEPPRPDRIVCDCLLCKRCKHREVVRSYRIRQRIEAAEEERKTAERRRELDALLVYLSDVGRGSLHYWLERSILSLNLDQV